MDFKIVAPMALWQGYNPTKQPLELSVLRIEMQNGAAVKSAQFTVDTVKDGKIRANIRMIYAPEGGKRPTMLLIPALEKTPLQDELLAELIAKGYNLAVIDYRADNIDGEQSTAYTPSTAYAQRKNARVLVNVFSNAEDTPWFIWLKVIRRAITFLTEEAVVDKDKIIVAGYKEGAQLAWQVAAIDGRVAAVIPVIGHGYTEYAGKSKYAEKAVPAEMPDGMDAWLAGASTQAYARLLMTPVLYLTASNSDYADIDRLPDLLSLIPSNTVSLSVTTGTSANISKSAFDGAFVWVDKILSGGSVQSPAISTYVSEGKLYALVKSGENVERIEIFTCYDETVSAYRSWQKGSSPLTVGQAESIAPIDVYSDTKRVFIYANVYYKSGLMLSTPEAAVAVEDNAINKIPSGLKVQNRIIFASSMTQSSLIAESRYPIVCANQPYEAAGPAGIKGQGVNEGTLCTYRLSLAASDESENYILQMDMYSPVDKQVTVNLISADDKSEVFFQKVQLTGSEKWQRFNFEPNSFKNSEMLPLKQWGSVKKLCISDCENVLFNNILWI